jgi:hypothetical protein
MPMFLSFSKDGESINQKINTFLKRLKCFLMHNNKDCPHKHDFIIYEYKALVLLKNNITGIVTEHKSIGDTFLAIFQSARELKYWDMEFLSERWINDENKNCK